MSLDTNDAANILKSVPELPECGALICVAGPRGSVPVLQSCGGFVPTRTHPNMAVSGSRGETNQVCFNDIGCWVSDGPQPPKLSFSDTSFARLNDTVRFWHPTKLELGTGNELCHVDKRIVVLAEEAEPSKLEAYRKAGIATVLITDVLERAQKGFGRWGGRVWTSEQEWPARKKLWAGNRPKPNQHADDFCRKKWTNTKWTAAGPEVTHTAESDDVDEVARRVMEGVFAVRRHPDFILQGRSEDDPDRNLLQGECFAKLRPWFDHFATAPLRCAVPPYIAAILDAIKHGGNWLVRPNAFVDAWNSTLQTVGGELYEMTFWRVKGSFPSPLCASYVLIGSSGWDSPVADKKNEIDFPTNNSQTQLEWRWPNEPSPFGADSALVWVLVNGCGEVAYGDFRLRIRRRIECAPSAFGGFQTARMSVPGGRRKSARARAEKAKRDDDSSYYDDDDGPSRPDSSSEDIDDNYRWKEDAD